MASAKMSSVDDSFHRWDWRFAWRLLRDTRRHRIDIIHSQCLEGLWYGSFAAVPFSTVTAWGAFVTGGVMSSLIVSHNRGETVSAESLKRIPNFFVPSPAGRRMS
jgi:hypothetical protein